MAEVPDVELLKTVDERLPLGGGGRAGLWLALAVGIAAAVIAAYVIYGRRHGPESATDTRKPVQVRQQPVEPLGGEADAIVLPPLAESDAVVRELVAKLSSHPAVAAWLTTDGLIRNFTVVVANIGEARTPAVHLRALRPSSKFQVIQRGGETYIDPRSYPYYAPPPGCTPHSNRGLKRRTASWVRRSRRSIARSNTRSSCCSRRRWWTVRCASRRRVGWDMRLPRPSSRDSPLRRNSFYARVRLTSGRSSQPSARSRSRSEFHKTGSRLRRADSTRSRRITAARL